MPYVSLFEQLIEFGKVICCSKVLFEANLESNFGY